MIIPDDACSKPKRRSSQTNSYFLLIKLTNYLLGGKRYVLGAISLRNSNPRSRYTFQPLQIYRQTRDPGISSPTVLKRRSPTITHHYFSPRRQESYKEIAPNTAHKTVQNQRFRQGILENNKYIITNRAQHTSPDHYDPLLLTTPARKQQRDRQRPC